MDYTETKERTNSWAFEYKAANQVAPGPYRSNLGRTQPTLARWLPPTSPTIKCNTDACFQKTSNIGTAAVIFRNNKGEVLPGCVSRFLAKSPLMAEAVVMRKAHILDSNLQIKILQFE